MSSSMKDNLNILLNHYKEENNDTFAKTKHGLPDMRNTKNRTVLSSIIQNRILEKNKSENPHAPTEETQDYRKDILDLTDEELDKIRSLQTETCGICYDSFTTSYTRLNCGHLFCPSCIIQHGRNKNDCPMCRTVVKNVPIPSPQSNEKFIQLMQQYSAFLQQQVMESQIYSYKSKTLTFKEYLDVQFTVYQNNKDKFIEETTKGVNHLLNVHMDHIEQLINHIG